MDEVPRPRGLYGQRPSKSADAARRAEFARIAAMTPQERMIAALRMGDFIRSFVSDLGEQDRR